jgi:hypothetical protein
METEIQKIAPKIFFPKCVLRMNRRRFENDMEFSERLCGKMNDANFNMIIRCVHEIFLMKDELDENYLCDSFLGMIVIDPIGVYENFESTILLHHLFPHKTILYEWECGKNIKLFRWLAEKNLMETTLSMLITAKKFKFANEWIEIKNLHPLLITQIANDIKVTHDRDHRIMKFADELLDWNYSRLEC